MLAFGTGCAQTPAPVVPAPDPVSAGCGERLAEIPYLLRRVRGEYGEAPTLVNGRLVLDDAGRRTIAEAVATLIAEPGLDLEIGMHMDAETRRSVAAGLASERLAELGDEIAAQMRSQVRPDRIARVVYGGPAAPPDGPRRGSRIALTRRCGPVPPDRDHDAIVDGDDACLDSPEDHDGHEDDDGCPDRDNDRDGVLDAHTWTGTRWTSCDGHIKLDETVDCRNSPEDRDGLEDDDGCPDVWVSDCAYVRGRVEYDPGSLRIDPQAIDAALAELHHWAERWSVGSDPNFTVWGHTGALHDKRQARALSERAATIVRDELVRRGIAAERLEIQPHGDHMPIASEQTPEGRRQNFRVEVVWEYCGAGAQPLCR